MWKRHVKHLEKVRSFTFLRAFTSKTTKVLGIETSCDDTGCAIVDSTSKILSQSLKSQSLVHLRNGGINPIIAHELHRDNIDIVVREALGTELSVDDVDAIAVTNKPGLKASLEVGVTFANYLARKYKKPLIPIHHMEAHALVARMHHSIPFPYIVLLISGGHCLLAVVNDVDKFILLGKSHDDAPGEALDKAARRLKLRNIPELSKMPGGQAIEMAARKSTNSNMFEFPSPLKTYRDCNFSFSGLKDSLNRTVKQIEDKFNIIGSTVVPNINDLCAAFQLAISEHLAHRTERAVHFCVKNKLIPDNCRNIVVSGGVACNDFIFQSIEHIGRKTNCNVYRPPPTLCTDNGVMIAWNGIEKLKVGCNFKTKIEMSDVLPVAPLGINYLDEVLKANIQTRVTRLKCIYNS